MYLLNYKKAFYHCTVKIGLKRGGLLHKFIFYYKNKVFLFSQRSPPDYLNFNIIVAISLENFINVKSITIVFPIYVSFLEQVAIIHLVHQECHFQIKYIDSNSLIGG